MEEIVTGILGIVCIIIGILNTKGNIKMLHSYHRNRVAEEDIIPFGKKVGLGMIIVGIGFVLFSCLYCAGVLLEMDILRIVAIPILAVGFVVGITISLCAIKKYNKGIFRK